MTRGKPLAVGPTAQLAEGMTWEQLAAMSPADIKHAVRSPTRRCRIRCTRTAGRCSPAQIAMFPRLERFDVEFDMPEAFLPEFPPAIFLQNRPELGDVSRGAGRVARQFPASCSRSS